MNTTTYTPRPGTKVALVADALSEGPMNTAQIGELLKMDPSGLNALLAIPLDREFFIKVKDAAGLLHYALGGTVLSERFTALPSFLNVGPADRHRGPELADAPVVKRVAAPSVTPSASAMAFAHPFRRSAASEQPEAVSTDAAEPATAAEQTAKAPAAPATPAEKSLVAGLFSNGELEIAVGNQSLRLSASHTRELFDYLDKITDMLGAPAGGVIRIRA